MGEAPKADYTARLKRFYVDHQIAYYPIMCNNPNCPGYRLGDLFLHDDKPVARTEVKHTEFRYYRSPDGLFRLQMPTKNWRSGDAGQRINRRPYRVGWLPVANALGDDNAWHPGQPSRAEMREIFDGAHPKAGDVIVCPMCSRTNLVPLPRVDGP
jgi:hypothetical protein